MTATTVRRDEADGVVTLTLDGPAKRNAMSRATFEALDAHLSAIEAGGDAVRAVLIRAEGPVFTAGADISGVGTGPTPVQDGLQARVIGRLAALPMPVVAAIHADCITGGVELVLAADIIVAADTARFIDSHGKWGLVPNWGMMQRLPRRIGHARAGWLAFTGRWIDAETAERWGLVDLRVPADRFDEEVAALLSDIVAQSGFTAAAYKRCFRETADLPLADGVAWEQANWPGSAPDAARRVATLFSRRKAGA